MNRPMNVGFVATISAHVIWGLLPIYWRPLTVMQPWHLIAWRMIAFMPLVWFIYVSGRGCRGIRFPGWNNSLKLFICSLLIIGNWSTFILGIHLDMAVEISLGYYIAPLVNVFLGVLFLGERLDGLRCVALVLASAALTLMSIEVGQLPLVSILLGLLFPLYGFVLKKLPERIGSIESLAWQSLVMGPVGLVILAFTRGYPSLIQGNSLNQVLLLGSGVATMFPLWLFGVGSKRLPLGVIGFLQYIGPSFILVVAVLVFGESFGLWRVLSFTLVFVALILYSLSMRRVEGK